MHDFFLKVRRGQEPSYQKLKRLIFKLLRMRLPIPSVLKPALRGLYAMHWASISTIKRLYMLFYAEPIFRSRCESVGKGTLIWSLPDVSGHVKIYLGKHVSIWGKIGVASGSLFDAPRLIIGDHVEIGDLVFFTVAKEIIVEEGTMIANNCHLLDTDSHPRDAGERAARLPPRVEDVKPVRIGRNVWICAGSTICKGVTVGEGAIIGTNSVVMSNVPPNAVALGNPAKVIYVQDAVVVRQN